MNKKIKIIYTNSYFHAFDILCRELEGVKSIEQRNLVFCEEKGSMIIEGKICQKFNGTFNTAVYSFGNFLRVHRPNLNALSKEGSSMVIKKLIGGLPLSLFGRGKDIAPTVYELIAQLKSAGVLPEDIDKAKDSVSGILKDKLSDIAVIFSAYENYLKENGLDDQSSSLSLLPSVIEQLDSVKESNVYLVGFSRLTKQNLLSIEALIKNAKSVTAILPKGENTFAFVNETVERMVDVAKNLGVEVVIEEEKTPFTLEGDKIVSSLFNPLAKKEKTSTDKISLFVAKSEDEEAEKIASVIKQEVLKGKRYKDFTIILPNVEENSHLKKAFNLLRVPFYLDVEYRVENHPLITLIYSYLDCFIKNAERETVLSLVKNPLYSSDKELNDAFINYVYKYNINYSQFLRPFAFEADKKEDFSRIEGLRQKLAEDLKNFNVTAFLGKCNVEEKLISYAKKLKDFGNFEEGAVSEQIYSKVKGVIEEMESILGSLLDKKEFKTLFTSGVSALKLSIIPQYNDAVFIGGFKECARACANNLFVCGLTSAVPGGQDDTALLSDGEIDLLANLKVIIEPKIKIVNHRIREEIAVSIASFSEKLYISYSANSSKGGKNLKSEIVKYFEENFTLCDFVETERYLTDRQGVKNFAIDCADFREWKKGDINEALAFHNADREGIAKKVLDSANSEMVSRIDKSSVLVSSHVSPTTIEEFYKCPFRSFMGHALGVETREIGEVSSLALGNVMHDIFYLFVRDMDKVKKEEEVKALFDECKEKVFLSQRYQKLLTSAEGQTSVALSLEECEKHCYSTYLFLNNSKFKVERENLEKKFEITLANGQVKLSGKIDRVDTFGEYFRVIDYKTGKVDDSDESLFTGVKLQLWLYALAIKDKKLAGAYYYDIEDEYKSLNNKEEPVLKGKTLANEEILFMQDENIRLEGKSRYIPATIKDGKMGGVSEESVLSACVNYAEKMCENAVKEMNDGLIIPSPIKGTCEWCPYKSACMFEGGGEREVGTIKEDVIASAVYGGKDNA